MPTLRGLVPAIITAAAALAPIASGATVVHGSNLDELVRAASRIVVTEVVEVRVERTRGEDVPLPVTLVTLRVLETLKGSARLQLALEFPGGDLDERPLEVAGMPRFQVGERDLLFLHDAPGMLSPVVGVFAGRFRVHGDLVAPSYAQAAQGALPLSTFSRAVRELVAAQRARPTAVPAAVSMLAASWSDVPLPRFLRVNLGPAPALANGCGSWDCAVGRAVEAVQPHLAAGQVAPAILSAGSRGATGHTTTVTWGTAIHGRTLDDLTLAVVMRDEREGRMRGTTIVLNGTKTWNAWDGRRPDDPSAPLDLVAVLSEALAAMAPAPANGATDHAPVAIEEATPGTRAAREPPSRPSPRVTSADPCGGGSGAMVNPRLLIFDSVDHARMTAYQVGFFLPRATSPVTVVNMPMAAFLERRVVDLPPGELDAMERTQVASISSAGLSTPIGHVYTYRVRGVWAGGATAWSAPSPRFVRCPQ
jgi:hypothetical protein